MTKNKTKNKNKKKKSVSSAANWRRQNEKRKKKQQEKTKKPLFDLESKTKQKIIAVVFFAFSILNFFSLARLTGPAGQWLNNQLIFLFGWGNWFFSLLLLVIAYFLIKPHKYHLKTINYLAFVALVISYLSLIHLFFSQDVSQVIVKQGIGGGYLGFLFSQSIRYLLGDWGSGVVFLAVLSISFVIISELLRKEDQQGKEQNIWQKIKQKLSSQKNIPTIEQKENRLEGKNNFIVDHFTTHSKKYLTIQNNQRTMAKIELPLDLLNKNNFAPIAQGDIKKNKEIIQQTLANFGVIVDMRETQVGPTITQYTLKPAPGVRLSQIIGLNNNLSLSLAAHPVRIEAPIPGKALVGIEIPNQQISIVGLKELLESKAFKKRKSNFTFALGKDVAGQVWLSNLEKTPHLLIAGATGSGKTVMLNSVIVSLLYQNSPQDLRFILIDPKRVELVAYNDIPYLLTPVITNTKKAVNALHWAIEEMNRRFELFVLTKKREIIEFNRDQNKPKIIKEQEIPPVLPRIVIVIDELADLMITDPREIETCIIRLSQMARATGIHLILSTQRPSVNVITGLIKANITSRIAFAVASIVDSRTILDFSGAEKLIGRGDMLFVSPRLSSPVRMQAAYLSENEIKKITDYLKGKEQPKYQEINDYQELAKTNLNNLENDELLPDARRTVIQMKRASASLLQRRLRVGYARAARLLDLLEAEGSIGPSQGAKPRKVLIDQGGEEQS